MECCVSVSTTTTGTSSVASDFAAELAAASEVKMTEWAKADAKGAPAEAPKVEDKAPAVDTAQVGGAAEAVEGTPETAPEAAPAPDLSWLPENLREKVSTLDPEVAEWVKGNVLRQSDYTKKTQAAATVKKEAEALKAKAENWLALEANPALADFAYRVIRGEAQLPGATTPVGDDDGIDLTSADNPTIRAFIDKRIEAKAREIAAEQIREKVERPVSERTAVVQSLITFATENKVDDAVMGRAIQMAEAHAERLGLKWNPENAAALVEPFVGVVKAAAPQAPSKPVAPPVSGGLSKVASPTSRPAANPPVSMPRHRREGRAPVTNEERVSDVLASLRERMGIEMSPNDLDSLVRGI